MLNAFGSIGMVFQLIATLGLGRKIGAKLVINLHLYLINKMFHYLDTLCLLLIWAMTNLIS